MHKRQLKKNKLLICIIYACMSLNFLCFGLLEQVANKTQPINQFILSVLSFCMIFVQFWDNREDMNSRIYVYIMLISISVLTIAFLYISFSWWILTLFIIELAVVITLIIRFRPIA